MPRFFEILSPSELVMWAIIENMISPEFVLCFGKVLLKKWKWQKFFGQFENVEIFGIFWKFGKITSYNFRSRRQIMTLGGVYLIKTLFPCLTKCLSLGQTFQTCVSGFTARHSASSLPNVWFLLFQIWFIKMAIFSSARSSYCHPDLLLSHQHLFFRSYRYSITT